MDDKYTAITISIIAIALAIVFITGIYFIGKAESECYKAGHTWVECHNPKLSQTNQHDKQ